LKSFLGKRGISICGNQVLNTKPFSASRPELGQNLWANLSMNNIASLGVFKVMNFAMYVEGQPLSVEHNEALEQALIKDNKGILDTLIAENPYVMKSTGYTPIYLLGKYLVHLPLEYYLDTTKKE
jgi:hypothetical protein